ncbi:hypothetical protein [Methanococcus maripaludis]|uniref:Uncharacterized protein n=2 Tax=Methanococcus maripaludis TaxID=39152 RepID=A0A7J9PEC9_METMI|nr:hypothetical protein [Methanococcus maripaludis]MBA2861605.1 hypothetical protein [Methanococcus maripaludis]
MRRDSITGNYRKSNLPKNVDYVKRIFELFKFIFSIYLAVLTAILTAHYYFKENLQDFYLFTGIFLFVILYVLLHILPLTIDYVIAFLLEYYPVNLNENLPINESIVDFSKLTCLSLIFSYSIIILGSLYSLLKYVFETGIVDKINTSQPDLFLNIVLPLAMASYGTYIICNFKMFQCLLDYKRSTSQIVRLAVVVLLIIVAMTVILLLNLVKELPLGILIEKVASQELSFGFLSKLLELI